MKDEDKQYIVELYKTLQYSNDQFDKNVLLIASGALGISFAFIEKLVSALEKAMVKDHLINSWIAFALVIFISLVSHFISGLSLKWSIGNFNNEDFEIGRSNWNKVIRFLNVVQMIGLLIGILLLIDFISKNIRV